LGAKPARLDRRWLAPYTTAFLRSARLSPARWQSGYAGDCKSPYIGSIPVRASSLGIKHLGQEREVSIPTPFPDHSDSGCFCVQRRTCFSDVSRSSIGGLRPHPWR
jgi:hypothetical protein